MKKAILTIVSFAIINGLSAQIGGNFSVKNGYMHKERQVINHVNLGATYRHKNVLNTVHAIIGVEKNTSAGLGYAFRLKTEAKKHSPIMGLQSSVIFQNKFVPDYRVGVAFGGLFSDKYFFTTELDYSTRAKALIYSLNLGIKIFK